MKRVLVVCALLFAGSRAASAEEIDYKKLYAQAAPGVVFVLALNEKGEGGTGTGSIIRPDGMVLTNAHVILDRATKQPRPILRIVLKPDQVTGKSEDLANRFVAQPLAFSEDMDLAVLRIVNAPAHLRVIEVSDDSKVGIGEATAAIGHPEKGITWALTTGRISGEWNDYDDVKGKDVYQMETSINHGNSGGPLLDGNGYMVGVNSYGERVSANGTAITSVNFAIKSTVVRAWLALVKENIVAAPEVRTPPPLSPKVIAQVPPAPPAEPPAAPSGGPPREAKTSIVPPPPPGAKRVVVSAKVPLPPPRRPRGFTSGLPPGRVISSSELTRQHARDAFDELDRETDDLGR